MRIDGKHLVCLRHWVRSEPCYPCILRSGDRWLMAKKPISGDFGKASLCLSIFLEPVWWIGMWDSQSVPESSFVPGWSELDRWFPKLACHILQGQSASQTKEGSPPYDEGCHGTLAKALKIPSCAVWLAVATAWKESSTLVFLWLPFASYLHWKAVWKGPAVSEFFWETVPLQLNQRTNCISR